MTSMRGHIETTRRPGELGVHSLDHFQLTVPDLKVARRFYGNFGLYVPEENGTLGMYVPGAPHRWGVISEGPQKQLGFISFGIFEDDFAQFRAQLQPQGVQQIDPPAGHESNGIWFRDQDGNLIEVRVARKTSPSRKGDVLIVSSPGGVRGARQAARQRRKSRHDASRICCCLHPMCPKRSISTAASSACDCRIVRATSSRLCTASTAQITTCWRSRSRRRLAITTSVGTWARCRISGSALCRC